MAKETKPSIYSDRGAIGSSNELDQYGVWVKSEPQVLSPANAESRESDIFNTDDDGFDDIDFGTLPDRFVLKCNHDCRSVMICKAKSAFNKSSARRWFNKKLRQNYYWRFREWQYKDIKPRIMAEEYLEDSSGELADYKVLCFNGEAGLVQVYFNRFVSPKKNVYTPQWEFVDVNHAYPNDKDHIIEKPGKLDDMLSLSAKIAKATEAAFVRVDWYCVEDRLYLGELTFTPGNGTALISPDSFDSLLGSWINLPAAESVV